VDTDRLIFAPRVREPSIWPATNWRICSWIRCLIMRIPPQATPYGAGCRVLTCRGTSFPGRVGASLLQAIGLPELVTQALVEYETVALRLAKDHVLLKTLRDKLAGNAVKAPLFDTDRSRRDLEAAYTTMWEAANAAHRPRHSPSNRNSIVLFSRQV